MIEEIVLNATCLGNKKDLLDIFIAGFTALSAIAAYVAAKNSAKSSEKQSKIDLYDIRYQKIYKIFFDTLKVQEETFLVKNDIGKAIQNNKKFYEEFDYARFLIKKEDFNNILQLQKKIYLYFAKFYEKYDMILKYSFNLSKEEKNKLWGERVNELPEVFKYTETIKKEFLKIIVPYLQIEEKEVWYKRIFSWIKDLFKKKKHD